MLHGHGMWFAGLVLLSGSVFALEPAKTGPNDCVGVNAKLENAAARGQLDDAVHIVSDATREGQNRLQPRCAGLLSNNLAAFLEVSGRLNEALIFSERAIAYFQESVPVNDPAYLRPLNMMATVYLELGFTRKADEVLQRMRSIPPNTSADRRLIEYVNGIVLQREGRLAEAESYYREALGDAGNDQIEAGSGEAAIRGQLASLYLEEERYLEAAKAVETALSRLNTAESAAPLYRIKLLKVRAVVWTRMERWLDAEKDLAEAISLCRGQADLDGTELQPIVLNYARVLRRLHRKDAKTIESWAVSLRGPHPAWSNIVDLTELRSRRH